MPKPHILYDGWPLAAAPNSPAALHLHAILELLLSEVDALIALPSLAPDWFSSQYPTVVVETPLTPVGALRWGQRVLPDLLKEREITLLHTTQAGGPLLAGAAVLVSPCGFAEAERPAESFAGRLDDALSLGGLARAAAVLWPQDLDAPDLPGKLRRLPVGVHPFFTPQGDPPPASLDLPERYLLAHPPNNPEVLRHIIDTWTWTAVPFGGEIPLVFAGLDEYGRGYLEFYIGQFELADSTRILPSLSPSDLAAVYRGCVALFHPAPASPWGGPARLALSVGRPVVSTTRADMVQVTGPAGFLLEETDARSLGGGVIASVVKEPLTEKAAANALEYSAAWHEAAFREALLGVYEEFNQALRSL